MTSQINKIIKDNLLIVIFSALILIATILPNFNFFGIKINLDYVVALISMLIIFQALKPMVESMDKNYAVILFGMILVIIFIYFLFYITILF